MIHKIKVVLIFTLKKFVANWLELSEIAFNGSTFGSAFDPTNALTLNAKISTEKINY